MPQVSREMALLNAAAGTKAASWIVGLLLTFGPPLVVYALGLMIGRYMNGQGVPQDDAEALKWTRKAAEQGDARGQTQLGIVYYLGRGMPQDYVRGHMWFNLSAAQGNKDGAQGRDIIAKLMTPAQIAEAQRLAREWMAKHGNKK